MKSKKPTRRRTSNRLTQSDKQALTMLDQLVAEDRRIEQKYNLPFRSPRTEDLIKQKNLPTYIIAPPSDPKDLDSPALLLKVYPEQEEPGMTTPPEWEALIKKLGDEHCNKSRKFID